MPDYEKELDKYEKSVEDHVKKVSIQLDEELANLNKKYKEKVELMRKMETENKKKAEENERIRHGMEAKKKKISNFEKQILKNKDNLLSFEAIISEIQEKLPQRQKHIDEIMKALNEKRRQVLQKHNEYGSFQVNRTENSMKTKLEKTKKKLTEMRKRKIAQDKKIARLRSDIAKSEKSFDKIERDIRREIERQFENESKKEEIERRIRIFEVENSGISDEFQKLLVSLNEDPELKAKGGEKRIGELEVLLAKGTKYLESLEEKIKSLREVDLDGKSVNATKEKLTMSPFSSQLPSRNRNSTDKEKRRSKSETPSKNQKRLEDLKKQIIQLKRESEALAMNKTRLIEEKESLQKTMDECEKEADRAAQELRKAENWRIAELNQQERKLQPSILIDSKQEKAAKEAVEKKEKLREKVEQLQKTTEEQKEELEKIRRRSEYLKRQLGSHSEIDLVQFENDTTEKGAEIRNLKRIHHEQVMTMNALNKKLQQRVLQREAAMTTANSVVHLTTNVREERNREIDELREQIAETRNRI